MSQALTEQEIEKLTRKFNLIDTDGDGYFSLDDYLAYLTQKRQNQTTVGAALYTTRVGFCKVKKKTKELIGNSSQLKFEKNLYIKVKTISKSTENSAKGWKQFLYKPYYENNCLMLKCFDQQCGGAHIEEFDMDFRKLKTVDVQLLQDNEKSRYWFIWKVSSLPHEFACTSQRDLEEWTQNIRYLHNRIVVSKAKIKAAEASGLAPKKKNKT